MPRSSLLTHLDVLDVLDGGPVRAQVALVRALADEIGRSSRPSSRRGALSAQLGEELERLSGLLVSEVTEPSGVFRRSVART
jgi:hypothetical protein